MANIKYINENFDLEGLVEIGFLQNATDYEYIEKRIQTYVGLDYIEKYLLIGEPKEKEIKAENIFSDN